MFILGISYRLKDLSRGNAISNLSEINCQFSYGMVKVHSLVIIFDGKSATRLSDKIVFRFLIKIFACVLRMEFESFNKLNKVLLALSTRIEIFEDEETFRVFELNLVTTGMMGLNGLLCAKHQVFIKKYFLRSKIYW